MLLSFVLDKKLDEGRIGGFLCDFLGVYWTIRAYFEGKMGIFCFLVRRGSDTDVKGWQVGLKTVFLIKKVKIITKTLFRPRWTYYCVIWSRFVRFSCTSNTCRICGSTCGIGRWYQTCEHSHLEAWRAFRYRYRVQGEKSIQKSVRRHRAKNIRCNIDC